MSYVLDIVCTGKRTHKRTRLTKITVDDGGKVSWRGGGSFHAPTAEVDRVVSTRRDGKPNEVFVADCPRCRRNLELKSEKFQLLLTALRTKRVSRLDISELPF